eukprot:tig00020961_g16698.t1
MQAARPIVEVQDRSSRSPAICSTLPSEDADSLRFLSGSWALPDPSKLGAGEDACFQTSDGRGFGVSDGVGGWSFVGIDSGVFSRQLMLGTKIAIEAGETDPIEALRKGLSATKAAGSATATVAVLDGRNMRTCLLGDSSFILIRNGAVVYRTEEQLHGFNFPFQLGAQALGQHWDTPEQAIRADFCVYEDDVVVAATDGLWDNLFDEEVLRIVGTTLGGEARGEGTAVSGAGRVQHRCRGERRAARRLAEAAHQAAGTPRRQSPFAKRAAEHAIRHVGGKMDDVTVVVGRVVAFEEWAKEQEVNAAVARAALAAADAAAASSSALATASASVTLNSVAGGSCHGSSPPSSPGRPDSPGPPTVPPSPFSSPEGPGGGRAPRSPSPSPGTRSPSGSPLGRPYTTLASLRLPRGPPTAAGSSPRPTSGRRLSL